MRVRLGRAYILHEYLCTGKRWAMGEEVTQEAVCTSVPVRAFEGMLATFICWPFHVLHCTCGACMRICTRVCIIHSGVCACGQFTHPAHHLHCFIGTILTLPLSSTAQPLDVCVCTAFTHAAPCLHRVSPLLCCFHANYTHTAPCLHRLSQPLCCFHANYTHATPCRHRFAVSMLIALHYSLSPPRLQLHHRP
jgi:hypothetical protein